MTVGVAVHGAGGRMGRQVLAAALESPEAQPVAAVERSGHDVVGYDIGTLCGEAATGVSVGTDPKAAVSLADVVIDFSLPEATGPLLRECAEQRKPAVVGTTGLDAEAQSAAEALESVAPLVMAPNFSQGVTLLFHLAARAAELLGPGFDAEIVEMHHRRKVDAPSGTAARLGEIVARAKGLDPAEAVRHGRSGRVGARTDDEIGVMALRGGDVVGEHTLVLAGGGERIELSHRAGDRRIFSRGAVRAGVWAARQSRPGRYDMADVMGVPR
jgi:4-hydroxy-tetrahydrodipicolinate reductase